MADGPTTHPTATDLLRQQHRQVQQMFTELATARGDRRGEVFDQLRAQLAVHETAEELIVYPELRSLGDTADAQADARLDEEREAKAQLAELEKLGVGAPEFDAKFETFRAAVLAHAEAEERHVFPLLEANVEGAKLREMGEMIEVAESVAPTHPHPHGPESSLGNLLVGPFVAVVDKVRDRVTEFQRERAGRS